MRTSWVALTGLSLSLAAFAAAMMPAIRSTAWIGKQADGSWLVVTQQVLRPWRQQQFIKGRPVDLAFNAGKSKLAILNLAGIELMDEETGAQQQIKTRSTSYCGIAFRPGSQELWSSEADMNGKGSLFVGTLAADGKLTGEEHITFPQQAFPAAIAFSPDGLRAFVALNNRNTVAVVDAASKTLIREIPVGLAPLFVRLSFDGKTLYVSNRGGEAPTSGAHQGFSSGTAMATDPTTGSVLNGTVTVIRLDDFSTRQVAVGRAPTALALSPDGKAVAVANAHSDSVSLIDTATLNTTTVAIPDGPDGLLGSAPVSLAFSDDGERLYVAAALKNAVVVLQRQGNTFRPAGAMPAGWFPATIAFDRNQDLVVLNVKGDGNTDNGEGGHNTHSYEGSMMRLPQPTAAQLRVTTQTVEAANNPRFSPAGGVRNLDALGIRHVFLIVKENRTYDQIFGDMPQGNSDPKFLMYGRDITPNHHALAEKYVLLDNFYATGAISFDGH